MPRRSGRHESAEGFMAAAPGAPESAKSLSRKETAAERRAERRLLTAARRGDPAALDELLARASRPAWRWSHGFCRNPEDAADLVQDVLLSLLRTLDQFRGESSLSTWTYTVARRACARRRERARRLGPLEGPGRRSHAERPDQRPGPEQRLERRALAERLESAIAELPESLRSVLVMRDVEGLSAAEVAEVLGLGERAVKSRLHRARLALRARLRPWVAGADAPDPAPGCPDTARLLSRYFEGELSSGVCERMESHVRSCPACGGACASLRSVLGACRAYGERAVPRELQRAVRAAVRDTLRATDN